MRINIMISLEEDVYTNPEVIKLRLSRSLSPHINELLRASFDIKKQEINTDEIEEELQQINIRKAILLEQKKQREKKEEKEAKRWRTII